MSKQNEPYDKKWYVVYFFILALVTLVIYDIAPGSYQNFIILIKDVTDFDYMVATILAYLLPPSFFLFIRILYDTFSQEKLDVLEENGE